MRFSLFYNFDILPDTTVNTLYKDIEEQTITADKLGFDGIWFAEHHFEVYGRMPSPLLFLSRLSAITKNIRLGTAIVEAPYYNPLRLAEDAALLDVLSGGRLDLGIGSGAANKEKEFERFGIPIAQKTGRTTEITTILHQAFTNRVVNFNGTFYQYEQIEISPQPLQSAEEIIWLAAGRITPEIAGKMGYGLLIPRVGPSSHHAEVVQRYRRALGEKRSKTAVLRFIFAAETEEEARQATKRSIERYTKYELKRDWDGDTTSEEYQDILTKLNAIIGTPEQVIAKIQELQAEEPFEELICQVYAAGMEQHNSIRTLDLLAREVLPNLQSTRTIQQTEKVSI